ncbi:MAG TPA: molybdopterin molybdotransferase MoeA [Candidatus Aminicenantes bacterium]|nr:molybdopterin molybdotransferase MoeA [Candidatus Aminicenantes bacterium]
MISIPEALALIDALPAAPRPVSLPLAGALGLPLAGPVISPVALPPFDKSAMDGYAVPAGDPGPWKLTAFIPAGSPAPAPIARGECAKIMTGAMLPEGAVRVVRVEFAEEADGQVRQIREETGTHISRAGEDVAVGDRLLEEGDRIGPAAIALAASVGLAGLPVWEVPRVGILPTGSELLPPGAPLAPGKIYDSNGPALAAQVRRAGGDPRPVPGVADTTEAIAAAVDRAIAGCDLLLISGGVSAGDLDLVPGALEGLGAHILFRKIAIQPGMPTLAATLAGKPVFGLPGNPVSTFVIFELFVRPLLARLAGTPFTPREADGVVATEVRRRASERTSFLPVTLRDGRVSPLPYHGSAHLLALARADALLPVPPGSDGYPAGTHVHVRLL